MSDNSTVACKCTWRSSLLAGVSSCIHRLLLAKTGLSTFVHTEESRFLEPPRETKIGSKNREFEKSKVASNTTKLLSCCFIRDKHAHFRSNRWEMADLSPAV